MSTIEPGGKSLRRGALGCVAHLALLGAVFLATREVVAPHVEPHLRPWIAAASAVLLTLGLSSFWSLARGYALLARAATGEPPAADGPVVVTGAARPLGPPLRAPLSGVECVAYQYRMYYRTSDRSERRRRMVPVYWGHACRPFRIDTAGRAIRVMAVPRLADEAARRAAPDDVERARQHVGATRFEEVGGDLLGALGTAFERAGEMFADEDGESRRDWRRKGDDRDPSSLLLEETVVPVGATVTAAGRWSTDRQAVVSSSGDAGPGTVTVVTGPPERLARSAHELPSSAWSVAVAATLLTGLGAGLVWLAVSGHLQALLGSLQ
jgi:hypothetical protein